MNKTLKSVICLVELMLLVLLLVPDASAQQPLAPKAVSLNNTNGTLTVLTYPASSTNTVAFPSIALFRGRGLLIWMGGLVCTNNLDLASNVTVTVQGSWDGTNWATTPAHSWGMLPTGTTALYTFTNLPPTILDNLAYARIATIANTFTNQIWITNLAYSIFP